MKRYVIAISVAFALLLPSCTTAPKGASPPKNVSEWVKHNLLGYDSTGYKVGADYVRAYLDLNGNYGNKLPITERVPKGDTTGITPVGNKFHVTFEVNKRFTDLQALEKESGP